MSKHIRVLIADDHPDVTNSVGRRLRAHGYVVLTPVHRLVELAPAVRRLRPDVVVLDIFFGKYNSLDSLSRLRKLHGRTEFVIYTGSEDPALVRRALACGVPRFVLKLYPEELVAAISCASSKAPFLSKDLRGANGESVVSPVVRLSDEERALLVARRSGRSVSQIAQEQGISVRTAERRCYDLAERLGLDARDRFRVVWDSVDIESLREPS